MDEISGQNSDLGLEGLTKLEAKAQLENTKSATLWGPDQKSLEMVKVDLNRPYS